MAGVELQVVMKMMGVVEREGGGWWKGKGDHSKKDGCGGELRKKEL